MPVINWEEKRMNKWKMGKRNCSKTPSMNHLIRGQYALFTTLWILSQHCPAPKWSHLLGFYLSSIPSNELFFSIQLTIPPPNFSNFHGRYQYTLPPLCCPPQWSIFLKNRYWTTSFPSTQRLLTTIKQYWLILIIKMN